MGGQDLGYQLPTVKVGGPVDDETLSPHHSAPPYVEHLGGGLLLVAGQTEYVEVLIAGRHHLLLLKGL